MPPKRRIGGRTSQNSRLDVRIIATGIVGGETAVEPCLPGGELT